jgi:uncharacterized membrane protein
MHKNKAYRPWYIAWSLEFCAGLVAVGFVVMIFGWSVPFLFIGGAILAIGAMAWTGFSLYVSKREQAEASRANDS